MNTAGKAERDNYQNQIERMKFDLCLILKLAPAKNQTDSVALVSKSSVINVSAVLLQACYFMAHVT